MQMQLVFIDNKRPVTDSLMVAESFGKRHADVLRSIENLESSEEFRQRNFALSSYISEQNKELPKYLITQDGFSFLVMGYTGKEAARFKEMYIGEFNRMRQQLIQPSTVEIRSFLFNPDTIIKLAENWKEERTLRLVAEQKIEEQRSKVVFAESLETSKDSILIGELAKLLKQNGIDIGATRLFEQLRQEGYLHKSGSQYNLPTQRSMDLGILEIKIGSRASATEGTKQLVLQR